MEKRREEGEGLCLQVQMFGGFSLSWGGKLVSGSKKTSESQFNYLMQLLLHHRREGVSRDMLERVLFEDRDILDVHHAARSVIYNAKRRLRAAGLPDLNYIEQRKGICYWTAEVPVWEDAAAFEALYEAAGREADPERRLGLYLQACRAYTGEFLPQQAAVFWVAREARRYRNIFCACMEEAVRLLRASQDFPQMRELGNYAMSISPLSDWETVTMEALVAMGQKSGVPAAAQALLEREGDEGYRRLDPSSQLSRLYQAEGLSPFPPHFSLQRLREAGIPTVVWLCPLLPFLNDTAENINGLLDLCQAAGVKGVVCFGMGLTLRQGSRAYFYQQLDRLFPGLKEQYRRCYGQRYSLRSPKSQELLTLFHRRCEKAGILHNNQAIFHYLGTLEDRPQGQLSLFDPDPSGQAPSAPLA